MSHALHFPVFLARLSSNSYVTNVILTSGVSVDLSTFLFMEGCLKFQVEEMEIPRAAAERSLREHKGDVVEALVSLTN